MHWEATRRSELRDAQTYPVKGLLKLHTEYYCSRGMELEAGDLAGGYNHNARELLVRATAEEVGRHSDVLDMVRSRVTRIW